MARRIEYSEAAFADLAELTRYGALEFGVAASRAFAAQIKSTVRTLSDFPFAGEATPGETFRTFVVRSHRIFYRAEDDRLLVLRILHARQLPPGLV
ncbi:MAG: type II toxin-antitoxin system RelE/ParE family toxin [Oceanicaulis sp.]